MRTLRIVASALLVLAILGTVAAALVTSDHYRTRIFPGVFVVTADAPGGAIDLGGLTRGAAQARLAAGITSPDQRPLTIQVGDDTWQLKWSNLGLSYDINVAVQAALDIGRDRPWWLGFSRALWPVRATVALPIIPADPGLARGYAEDIAAEVAALPQDATLSIAGGRISATPAQDGRQLDVDTATAKILDAIAGAATSVELTPDPLLPQVPTAEPALGQATALLSEPFVLIVDDPLTGDPDLGSFRREFAADPQSIGSWLRPIWQGDEMQLNVDVWAVRDWVETVSPQLGEERTLDVDGTTARVVEALRTPTHQAAALVRHSAMPYVVQSGDTFYDIAYLHGFPQWQLEQANPDVDPGQIDVGQVLTIPSIDVLFPHPLVEGKRIEIDLPTQTLRAYENEAQVFTFSVSSGISTTPTLAGQFEVLFKEDMAFAQRWSLDMPYFMAFYEEGDGFFNGIHELPITSYGARLSPYVLGWPASYGCIILDVGDAEALYSWAPLGTLVRVDGVAPGTPFGQETLLDIAPLVETEEP